MGGNARDSKLAVARFGLGTAEWPSSGELRLRPLRRPIPPQIFALLLSHFVSMDGIEPSSKAYESFVLPLNYTDSTLKYNRKYVEILEKSLSGFFCTLLRGHDWVTNISLAVAREISLPRLVYFFC